MRTAMKGTAWRGEDEVDGEPFVTVKIRRMPAGYVASLPEHEGW